MIQKESAWKTTCNRFVAFIDIMGFRDLVYRNNHDEVYKMLYSFESDVDIIESIAQKRLLKRVTKSKKKEHIS